MPQGLATFVISLDCELHWGVHDRVELEAYRRNLEGGRQLVAPMLDLFERYGIRATWATVGLLFARSRREVDGLSPRRRPAYTEAALSAYRLFDTLGEDEEADPLHYAASIINAVGARAGQEIASHTFSHYYALEPGQDAADFRADLLAAKAAAAVHGYELTSLVFPRNQVRADYLPVLAAAGFSAYRGTPRAWPYRPHAGAQPSLLRRGLRLADSHVPLLDTTAAPRVHSDVAGLVDVPATRYLRAWKPTFGRAQTLRFARVRREMHRAAETGGLVHLWWHPHDFGAHPRENLAALVEILEVYDGLHREGRMVSQSMRDVANTMLAHPLPA